MHKWRVFNSHVTEQPDINKQSGAQHAEKLPNVFYAKKHIITSTKIFY